MNKHNHCYPDLLPGRWIESNWLSFTTPEDIKMCCYCTMQELCKALVVMEDEKSRQLLHKAIHKLTNDQKDLKF